MLPKRVPYFSAYFAGLTQSILKIFLAHEFEVLLDGFGAQRILTKDQVLVLATSVHLRHHQIRQEVLDEQTNNKQGNKLSTQIPI